MNEIRVKLYGALALMDVVKKDKDRIKNGFLLRIDENTNIKDVLDIIKIPAKDAKIVSIGKERVMLDAQLRDGDVLHVFPLLGGG